MRILITGKRNSDKNSMSRCITYANKKPTTSYGLTEIGLCKGNIGNSLTLQHFYMKWLMSSLEPTTERLQVQGFYHYTKQ